VTHPLLFQELGFKPLYAQVVDPIQKIRELQINLSFASEWIFSFGAEFLQNLNLRNLEGKFILPQIQCCKNFPKFLRFFLGEKMSITFQHNV
jgi:hypothetical protein